MLLHAAGQFSLCGLEQITLCVSWATCGLFTIGQQSNMECRTILRCRAMQPLLDVHNIHVEYCDSFGRANQALKGVNLRIDPGEILGILGESGSGKSTLAQTILQILPSSGRIAQGHVLVDGNDIATASERELEKIRGVRVSMIFQESAVALHPAMRAVDQVANILAVHGQRNSAASREEAYQTLREVFGGEVDHIFDRYPHQLSGGERQRVLIAQAIACRPALIIADEPTASLDTTTQSEILSLFRGLRNRLGVAMILITHNPALLSSLADRIVVLYSGRIVEEGASWAVLHEPRHPYTQSLLRAMPPFPGNDAPLHKAPLPTVPGVATDLSASWVGCRFEPRCSERMTVCAESEPGPIAVNSDHEVCCFKYSR